MRSALVTVLVVPLLASCAALGGEDARSDDGVVDVVAAFYPLEFVAERVSGHGVDNLTSPGGEPHDLELGVRETAVLSDADLLLVLHGFQPAVDDAVTENASGEVLDVEDVVELEEFAEHEHEADDHGHREGDHDPHFWLDPLRMADLGDAVADRLADLDPDGAETYTDNAAALREELEALDQEYAEGLADCGTDVVVTNHDAFGYLGRYGLHLESIAGISPDAEPTPAALARLQDLIDEEGVTTVFSEALVSPATAETLARDAGVDTAVLDTIEGLTDATADQDYVSLMRANLGVLQEANRC